MGCCCSAEAGRQGAHFDHRQPLSHLAAAESPSATASMNRLILLTRLKRCPATIVLVNEYHRGNSWAKGAFETIVGSGKSCKVLVSYGVGQFQP